MKDEDKTKEQLSIELEELRQRITELETSETERKQTEHDLEERYKELNCLYGVGQLMSEPDTSLDEVLHRTVDLIPSHWQYPEITCARIIINGHKFQTENCRDTKWKQSSDILIQGEKGPIKRLLERILKELGD